MLLDEHSRVSNWNKYDSTVTYLWMNRVTIVVLLIVDYFSWIGLQQTVMPRSSLCLLVWMSNTCAFPFWTKPSTSSLSCVDFITRMLATSCSLLNTRDCTGACSLPSYFKPFDWLWITRQLLEIWFTYFRICRCKQCLLLELLEAGSSTLT